jgi:hypothetical protein
MVPEPSNLRKEWLSRLIMAIVVILVGLSSFGLGRISAFEELRRPVLLHGAVVGGIEQPLATSSAL